MEQHGKRGGGPFSPATRNTREDWFQTSDLPKDRLFDGTLTALQLREGFGLHTLNARSRRDFHTRVERAPGVVLHCFLEGRAEASLDGKDLGLGHSEGQPVRIVLTSVRHPAEFRRSSAPGDYVRKISILMSHEWLDENDLSFVKVADDTADVFGRFEAVATPQEVAAMERLASQAGFDDPIARLQAEAAALGLVAGSFEKALGRGGDTSLSRREMGQLTRMEDIARAPGPMPTLADLAHVGGVSQSTMRRLFRARHGCSALAYVRRVRLEEARAALAANQASVSQAARMAGYASPENFATAFRRLHGMPPSQARTRRN
ncbi:helix-turn-helix transcriptional regulator [Aliiroseovarius sp.]|uniref:helix-turn-helix transcriptional regulator n=1 Tax=Aliiroseovarius sp. TaxID=1872442 RepID=UPI003BAD46F8